MYSDRVATLKAAYRVISKNNKIYMDAVHRLNEAKSQLSYVTGLSSGLSVLERLIMNQQAEWQDSILRTLEAKISEALAIVYPEDGYTVSLKARLLRGKIHIEGTVRAFFLDEFPGTISDSQGRLFQQVVSFAALLVVMNILGVDTVYVDEAFSGASLDNAKRVNRLLKSYSDRGVNIILIAQNAGITEDIPANILRLDRTLDNVTIVTETEVLQNE